jgi:ubiquinone/menaquinone biosynthesis C-methylase UbiE
MQTVPTDVPRADRLVEFLFRVWSRVYDQPLFQKPFYRRVHTAVLRTLDPLPAPRRLIDLGCGTAQLTADLAARFGSALVVGVDLSAAMLAAARRRLGPHAPSLVRANVYALPFADRAVDLVTSTISYHWYLEPSRALAEVRRVLVPGGHFVLATLASRMFRGAVARARFVPAADHLADLRAAGFAVVATTRVRPGVRVFTATVQ